MNLREFTETVDLRAKEKTKEDLQMLVHSLARKVLEENREEFLAMIEQAGKTQPSEKESKDTSQRMKALDKAEVKKEYARLKKQFLRIQEKEIIFLAEGYEDYSSGYWDSDWVYEYEDPFGIGKTYEEAARLVERCVNDGFYGAALKVFDLMMETEAWANDGGDGLEMYLEDIISEKLAVIDTELLRKTVLYGLYMHIKPEKRVGAFYEYLSESFFHGVKLEEILTMGKKDLPDSARFVKEWITFLLNKPGDTAAELLRDAVFCQQNLDEMMETAQTGARCHPSLVVDVLKAFRDRQEFARQLTLGREALEVVEKRYLVRSQIALLTAQAALKTENLDLAEICWQKAFESDTNLVNYLRIAAESRDGRAYREKAVQVVESVPFQKEMVYGREINRELAVNYLTKNRKTAIQFFMGDFDGAMKCCKEMKEGLGWSGEFIKGGIPLFLLLLLCTDTLGEGGSYAAGDVACYLGFRAEEYEKGMFWAEKDKKESDKTQTKSYDGKTFWQCFSQWKKTLLPEELPEEKAKKYLEVLEKLIDLRVKAIISGQHRNHYGSVAALAAALGEVKESRGEAGAKSRLLLHYREEFPRHTSFHQELRSYGMPDTRKGARKGR